MLVISSLSHCETSSIFTVVALCDNSAQRIMGGGDGIAHVDKAAFGHLLAVPVFVLGKVQVLHGLVGQAGIVKRRALVLPDESQGFVL